MQIYETVRMITVLIHFSTNLIKSLKFHSIVKQCYRYGKLKSDIKTDKKFMFKVKRNKKDHYQRKEKNSIEISRKFKF